MNDDRYGFGILLTCETLHMSNSGASDPLPDDRERELRKWLMRRYEDWRPSYGREEYDLAVLGLVEATLCELGELEPKDADQDG